jgi:hypothetical protein
VGATLSRRTFAILAAVLLAAACAKSGATRTGEQWRLSEAPALRIGIVDGEPAYQLDRVAGLLRLSDGRIVLANGGTQELRFYDAHGRHLATAGGAGAGPGEFRALASLDLLPGDSLLVLDPGTGRISVLDPDGALVRSWRVESPGRGLFPSRALALGDGSVLIAFFRGHMPGDPGGTIRNAAPLLRYSAEGEPLGVVAEIPGEEWFSSPEHGILTYRPFGRKGHLAVAGTSIFVGGADAYEVDLYDPSGQLQRTLTQPREPVAITADAIRHYKEARLQELRDPATRPRQERINAALPFPEAMPAYASLLADDEGNLWVEEYRYPAAGDPADSEARWNILDPLGRLVASLRTPRGFQPHLISRGHILGISRDDLDVEFVEVYELIRP